MKLIVAVDNKWGIGRDNDLLCGVGSGYDQVGGNIIEGLIPTCKGKMF